MHNLTKLFSDLNLGGSGARVIEFNGDLDKAFEIISSSTSDTGSVVSDTTYSAEPLNEECFFVPASGNDAAFLAHVNALENGHYDTTPSPLLSREQLDYAHDFIFGICC